MSEEASPAAPEGQLREPKCTCVLKEAPAKGSALGATRSGPHRLSFHQCSWCRPPPDCPLGEVLKSSEGQPHEKISCLLPPSPPLPPLALNDDSGHSSDREQFCNPSTPPAAPFPTIIPKIRVCEPPKVLAMLFRLVEPLSHRGCKAKLPKRSTALVPLGAESHRGLSTA